MHLSCWEQLDISLIRSFLLLTYLYSLTAGEGLGEGYGMLGQAGSGKLRLSVDHGANKLAAKVTKRLRSSVFYWLGLLSSVEMLAYCHIERQ